jgi:hypothetical protein
VLTLYWGITERVRTGLAQHLLDRRSSRKLDGYLENAGIRRLTSTVVAIDNSQTRAKP